MAAETSGQSRSATSIYAEVENYPWNSDDDFKNGLDAILGANPSPEQAAELTLRARCFYYARNFNTDIDFDRYKAWREHHGVATNGIHTTVSSSAAAAHVNPAEPAETVAAPSASTSQGQSAPYPSSFAEIVELISSGQPIPGIKEIPDTVLTGQGTQSSATKRKKPWEKETDQIEPSSIVAQGGE